MNEIHFCHICDQSYGLELHHVIYRSQVSALSKCKLNLVWLCRDCHRDHKRGVHHNKELDTLLKLEFQNKLELLLLKNDYEQEEIQQVLGISINAVRSLCKLMKLNKGKYTRESIIRACMAGKLIEEGD